MPSFQSFLLHSIRDYPTTLRRKSNFLLYLPLILFIFIADNFMDIGNTENQVLTCLGVLGINSLLVRELQKYLAHNHQNIKVGNPSFHFLKFLSANLILFSPSVLILAFLLKQGN